MNKTVVLLCCLALLVGCAPTARPQTQQNQENRCIASIDAFISDHRAPGGATHLDPVKILGSLSVSKARYREVKPIPIECKPEIALSDLRNDMPDSFKAINAGKINSERWVIYLYPAERFTDELYGYMISLVVFDGKGMVVTKFDIAELMAYEGHIQVRRATVAHGSALVCTQEAELFSYNEVGDITGELPAPKLTDEQCESIDLRSRGVSHRPPPSRRRACRFEREAAEGWQCATALLDWH